MDVLYHFDSQTLEVEVIGVVEFFEEIDGLLQFMNGQGRGETKESEAQVVEEVVVGHKEVRVQSIRLQHQEYLVYLEAGGVVLEEVLVGPVEALVLVVEGEQEGEEGGLVLQRDEVHFGVHLVREGGEQLGRGNVEVQHDLQHILYAGYVQDHLSLLQLGH